MASSSSSSSYAERNKKLQDLIEPWSIVGKVCMVTGASSGIGRYTAMELARRGAKRVILACRNAERAEEAINEIRKTIGQDNSCELVIRFVDFSSLQSVRSCCEEILATEKRLDVLINNAAVLMPDNCFEKTTDGFEMTFQINFLGPFLLTQMLIPLMKNSTPARIVNVSSQAYEAAWPKGFDIDDVNQERHMTKNRGKFSYWRAYSQSKLAIVLYSRYLDRQLNKKLNLDKSSSGIAVFTLHPGEIRTNITRHHKMNFIKVWLKFWGVDADKGGANVPAYCACEPGLEKYSGQYFGKSCKVESTFGIAKDDAKTDLLMERCFQWVGIEKAF